MVTLFLTAFLMLNPSFEPSPVANHAIYLSVCEIDHRGLDNTAEINIRVFETDIRDAFQNMFSVVPDFFRQDAGKVYGDKALQYFRKYLKIELDGKPAELEFRSMEINGDSVWFYFLIKCSNNWNSVNVTADYLMELFPDQSNVVSIYNGPDKKFLRITRDSKSQSVNFQR